MTTRSSNRKDKKGTKKEVRRASPEETHANNYVAVETASRLTDPRPWLILAEKELEDMNRGKVGRPYTYCDSMLMWIMLLMGYLDLDYRQISGFSKTIMSLFNLKSPSYSTIFIRIRELTSCILLGATVTDSRIYSRYARPCRDDRVREVTVDSTGLNLSETSLWRKNKWGIGPDYRGWLKLHALTDCDTNEILAYVLTDDQVSDNAVFEALVDLAVSAGYRIRSLRADAAYCATENFKICKRRGIEFITKFKSNTQPTNNGSLERGKAARLWASLPYDLWLEATGYGRRWKVESAFSDFKRLLSEQVSARTKEGMNTQVAVMVKAFDMHKEVRNELLGITGNGVAVA